MNESRTLLLNDKQIRQKINRLAYQVYEDNLSEKEIILAGIMKSGFQLCEIIASITTISPLKVIIAEVHIDKHGKVNTDASISINKDQLNGKVVILIDDVLDSGKTLMYSLKPFLASDIKKIRTVVLIDRNHKKFSVSADFVGLTLSTALKEHVTVEFFSDEITAWLS